MKAGTIARKSAQLVLASGTKVSSIFFAGIAVTVAGGVITAYSPSGGRGSGADERYPASVQEGMPEGAAGGVQNSTDRPGRFLAAPVMPTGLGSRSGSEAASDMANQLARAAEDQAAQNANAPQPEPISVTTDAVPTERVNPGQEILAGKDRDPVAPTATGTSTGTAPNMNTNGYGGSVNTSSGTATSTDTSTATPSVSVTDPTNVTLVTSQAGWAGVCQKAAVSLVDMFGNFSRAPSALTITLSTDSGSFYSDAGCATPTTTLQFGSGTYTANAYFRAAATANLTASEPSLSGAIARVTIASPAASLALGQVDLTSHAAAAPATGVSAPSGVIRVNGKLVVADTANNRVLIWNTMPTSGTQPANIVLGQPDFSTITPNTGGVVSAISLSGPTAVASDGTRLAVVDAGNHRVLLWDAFPTTPRAAASHVVGQANMAGGTANRGGVAGAGTLSSPSCALISSGALFVCDKGNNRILGWPAVPAADAIDATFAIGQPDLITVTAGFAANRLDTPTDAAVINSRLFVSDSANNRILAWASVPTSGNTAATIAIGQANTGTNGASATSAGSLSAPGTVRADSQGRLLITDVGNHRVLVWNKAPLASGTPADGVIGQATFAGNSSGSTANALDGPTGLEISGSELWISDTANNRVLEFTLP